MSESRTINSVKNLSMNITGQVLLMGFRFISRTIFIHYLSVEYLGIDSLFSNVLSMLALADLGITSALNYSLYKPIRDQDQEQIKKLMQYFKKIYLIIATTVLLLGLALVPFLHLIVNLDKAVPNVHFYYILMLLSVVMSYLFVYRSALVIASQKEYLVTRVTIFTQLLRIGLQIIVLMVFQNFALYLVVPIVIELLDNLIVSRTAMKLYPYLNEKTSKLEKSERRAIFENIKSIFAYRFSDVVMNNTNSIFISILVGTIYVGYYTNYMMLVSSISMIVNMGFSSISASVGNKNVGHHLDEQEQIFQVMVFINQWVAGFCAICFLVLLTPFIQLWVGNQFVLSNLVIFAIVIQFYITTMMSTTAIYRDTTGIFKETKYIVLINSAFNVIFCLVLGHLFGIVGILLSASISRLLTSFWFEPKVLYEKYFGYSCQPHFYKLFKYILVTVVEGTIVWYCCQLLPANTILNFILKGIICVVFVNGISFVVYRHDPTMKFLLSYLRVIKTAISQKWLLLHHKDN
ncbi:transporter [Lapidilactobacillus dextrinicus DSM 20335]|uniref:Transporter n=1 Tax=Lapidilactobacillus dextrinicus DSM 20335 TaxID=1423738 RepID=A0A0R2BFT0_9LACO|nr:oligosaccharide flippase family protein [Lapidilactobacillus dextrinicus]KRM78495.1 transporter [Lapidilactobacillus dextrinicus DSM 20335]QFG46177.1 oligosaccharide flippase family protein [Lapidilactobacillus dextrinicus]